MGRLLSLYNLRLIIEQSVLLMISCVGVTFVMSMGSLDFSQGSVLAICAVVAAVVGQQNIILGFLAALALASSAPRDMPASCFHGVQDHTLF